MAFREGFREAAAPLAEPERMRKMITGCEGDQTPPPPATPKMRAECRLRHKGAPDRGEGPRSRAGQPCSELVLLSTKETNCYLPCKAATQAT